MSLEKYKEKFYFPTQLLDEIEKHFTYITIAFTNSYPFCEENFEQSFLFLEKIFYFIDELLDQLDGVEDEEDDKISKLKEFYKMTKLFCSISESKYNYNTFFICNAFIKDLADLVDLIIDDYVDESVVLPEVRSQNIKPEDLATYYQFGINLSLQ